MPIERVLIRARESSGYSQTSGMGYMLLADRELYFELALLDLVVAVSRVMLSNAEYVYRLKGVSPGRKMLKISFTDTSTQHMDLWRSAILRTTKATNIDPHFFLLSFTHFNWSIFILITL